MRESKIQKQVCDYATTRGCLVFPFKSPSNNSVPDRIIIPPKRHPFFIEFKTWGKIPSMAQGMMHTRLRAAGTLVYVVDSVEHGKSVIDRELKRTPC